MTRLRKQDYRKVLEALRLRGEFGGTSEEVARDIGIDLQSISPRFAPLRDQGLIALMPFTRQSGMSRRKRQVWALPQYIETFNRKETARHGAMD